MSTLIPPGTAEAPSDEHEPFGLLMLSVRQALSRVAERTLTQHGFGLNLTQLRVLTVLDLAGPLTATELARRVGHDGGALTRLLDCLQDEGYVVRRQNPNDRRSIEVHLTEAGQTLFDTTRPAMLQFNESVLQVLADSERQQLFALMKRIRAHLEQMNDQA